MKGSVKRKFPKINLFPFLMFGIAGYLFFLVGGMVYENYKFNNKERLMSQEIEEMKQENQKLREDIAYFKTEEFKEKEAREKLNKQKEGEKVIVISPDENEVSKIAEIKAPEVPNYIKWWQFVTNRLEK